MVALRIFALVSIQLLVLCFPLNAPASPRLPGSPLDDTAGIVDLAPDSTRVLACTPVSITVSATFTDARVFDLRLSIDPARLQFLSAVAGSDPSLHMMPPQVSGGVLSLDGFFHPNFTGTVLLMTLGFYVNPVTDDDTTVVRFETGQGYSGTEDNPVPIQFTGDSAVIYIEGTPPDPPQELIITRLNFPANDDSVRLDWHPIFYDIDGDTVVNPLYVIFREHVVSNPGVLDSIGATPDTFFYDTSILLNPDPSTVVNATTLTVKSRKTQP